MPKNIQVIDGALNCTYDIFQVSDADFALVFPEAGQDVEFSEDLFDRLTPEKEEELSTRLFMQRVEKRNVCGIHGTLFYGLASKRPFYPTKREGEMITGP